MLPISSDDHAARVQVSKQFFLWFDEPADWNAKLRKLRLSGWCVAKQGAPLTAIRASLRGRMFEGRFDRERPEVAAYVGVPAAPRWCGFTVDLQVPFGRGRLEFQVARAAGQWQKAYARDVWGPLRVSPEERGLWKRIEARDRFACFIDRPADWLQPARTLYISGWCVDLTGDAIQNLRAVVGGRTVAGNYGFERTDVAARFPALPLARMSGFAVAVDLAPGPQTIALELSDGAGTWRQFLREDVVGAAPDAPPTEALPPEQLAFFAPGAAKKPRFNYWFDRPADWSGEVRHLQISGWCVASFGGRITEMRARIARKTFTVNYGILRPDVAVIHASEPAALRSGFSGEAIVPWGKSTLVLEARSGSGPWEPVFTTAVRGPMFRGRPGKEEAVGNYTEWIQLYDRVSRQDEARIRREIAGFERQPTFSILLPAYNTEARWLQRTIASVRAQFYPQWQLCIVDDASTSPHVWKIIAAAARRDPRIKTMRRATNGHISAASNDALALATGDYIALLDHDDELAPTALYYAARELTRDGSLQLLYSDEDKLDAHGRRCDPYFKSDWNPDLLNSQNYISHLSIYATELVRKVGGFRVGFEGSQDHDLTLRCAAQITPAQILHLPHVLYHWRSADQSTATFAAAKPYAHDAAIRAVQEHIDRGPAPGRVVPDYGDYLRVVYSLPPATPLVTIIIPTRDRVSLLRQGVESIRAKTDYTNYELLLIDNESDESETLDYLQSLAADGAAEVLRIPGEFNFSRLNNLGVAHARGEFVALLNNDLEVMNAGWLTEMVSQIARPNVGAVGARLWYPDGRLQHGGVLLGVGGVATHAHRLLRKEHGYFARARLTQNFSAVTGACMVLRKAIYEEAGGLDETNLPVAFNDVDLCLRLRERGLLVVWTPHAELIHHESASRGFEDTGSKQQRFMSEVAYMQKRWGHLLEADPYYNPNLSIAIDQQWKLAFPPRVTKPWT